MHGGKMLIACPNCHATYDVPESRLDAVLSLRCSSCHYSWEPRPARPTGGYTNRQQSTASSTRKPQPGTGFKRAASQPQQDPSSSSMSSVTVSSLTVSSVTVSSNQPAAANMDIPETPQMDPKPTPRPAPFTTPEPAPKPSPAPKPAPVAPEVDPEVTLDDEPDYVVHLTSARQTNQSPVSLVSPKQPEQPEQNLFSILVGSAMLVLILLTLAILTRHGLMKIFPASTAFFKALGVS